jgi:hypothetical protein
MRIFAHVVLLLIEGAVPSGGDGGSSTESSGVLLVAFFEAFEELGLLLFRSVVGDLRFGLLGYEFAHHDLLLNLAIVD